MPKERAFDKITKSDEYVVLWSYNGKKHFVTVNNLTDAIKLYRDIMIDYGDSVRLARVVFDYGTIV